MSSYILKLLVLPAHKLTPAKGPTLYTLQADSLQAGDPNFRYRMVSVLFIPDVYEFVKGLT